MSHTSNSLKMLMILNAKGLVKSKEIAEILEVKERMVRNYKQDLEMAGIHIGTKAGRYGGYYLEQKSFLPNVHFQSKELAALDMAYDFLMNSKSFPEKNHFKMLYHQISSMALSKEEVDQYIYFIHKSKPRDTLTKDNELFLQLRSAILDKKKVVISYQGWKGKLEERTIHPYGLINYNNSWYCRAYCEMREGQRTFKLLRIQMLKETDECFILDQTFNIREDKMGICDDEYDMQLQVFPPYAHTISESIWGENQEMMECEDGSVIFKARMSGKESIVKWILGMGSGVKVIEPIEIRERVKEELKKAISFY